jgi:hypothetical protein
VALDPGASPRVRRLHAADHAIIQKMIMHESKLLWPGPEYFVMIAAIAAAAWYHLAWALLLLGGYAIYRIMRDFSFSGL